MKLITSPNISLDREYEKIDYDPNIISCRRNELGVSAVELLLFQVREIFDTFKN